MKINYILSDSTKYATSIAIKEIIKKSKENLENNILVIVPETKSIIIERELLSMSKNGALINVFVYSFVRLINKLKFIDKTKLLSKQAAIILLKKIIIENCDKFVCYKKTVKSVHFAEKIYESIQQLKSSKVTPEDLKQTINLVDSSLKVKLTDIALIFEEYEKLLSNGFVDDCDKLNLLSDLAKTSELIKKSDVYFVGFDNITGEMVDVIREFAKSSKSVTFSSVFFAENRSDKYIQNNELFGKFKLVASSLNYPYVPQVMNAPKQGDFYYISNDLFSNNLKQKKYNGDVKVFEADTKESEIRFLATKIIDEINSGKRYHDIGVLALDLAKDEKILRKVFDEFEINYFINKEFDISHHFAVNFISTFFELFSSHFNSKNVLRFLHAPFFNFKFLSNFENFVNMTGLNYNDFFVNINEKFDLEQDQKEQFSEIFDVIKNVHDDFDLKIKNAKTCKEFVNIIFEVLAKFDLKEKLIQIGEFQKKCGFNEESEISLAIYEKINESLQIISNFIGDQNVDIAEFLQILLSSFGSQKINLAPLSIDAVVLQNNTDGFFDIKDLFICGATDSNFPSKTCDQGILLDDEIDLANKCCDNNIEPKTTIINDRARFAAYEALLEPKEKLYISYCKNNIDGSENKKSIIIQRLEKLFGDKLYENNVNFSHCKTKKQFENEFASNLEKYFDGHYELSKIVSEFNILKNDLSTNFLSYILKKNQSETNFDVESAGELFFKTGSVSVSELESYFSCPYKHFTDYGLKLKENKVAKLSKLDVGVVMHSFAEKFVKNIKSFEELNENKFDEKVKDLLNDILQEQKINLFYNKTLLNSIFDEAKRLSKYLLEEQKTSLFKASNLEYNFKNEGILFDLIDGSKIRFDGKVDRIDTYDKYIRIIDYKTGDIKNKLSSIYYGKKVQLVSYLFAITKLKDSKIAGILYFPIHADYVKNDENFENNYKMTGFLLNDIEVIKNMDTMISFENPSSKFVPIKIKTNKEVINSGEFIISRPDEKFLSSLEFENLKIYFKNLCETALLEMKQGNIEPAPYKKGDDKESLPCLYCQFAGFCGLENSKFINGRKCVDDLELHDFCGQEE